MHRKIIVNTSPLFYLHRLRCFDIFPKMAPLLHRLNDMGFYLSNTLINEILKISGERSD